MCSQSQTSDYIPLVEEAKAVVERAKDSGVGPDGLPYSAYKPIAMLIACIIVQFFQVILCGSANIPEDMMLAFMVFLPRKSFTMLQNGLKLYKSENLRPLSLSNTFIKLVVTCLKTQAMQHCRQQNSLCPEMHCR